MVGRVVFSLWMGALACGPICGCGARTEGNGPPDPGPVSRHAVGFFGEQRCDRDEDCTADLCARYTCVQTFCVEVERKACPANPDPCLVDECDPDTGLCVPEHATPDEDGDGHYAARPGYAPGDALACGDDCDDTHGGSYPGGTEVCDGHDNDCNGSTDEGFSFSGPSERGLLVSEGAKEAGLGGLVHDGELFVLSYSSRFERSESVLLGMRSPRDVEYRSALALTNSDTYAGPVAWTGSRLTTAWEDRRDEDFEIYWNRFDRAGNKLGPDVRLSEAEDFSLNPSLVFLGQDQLVFWQDRRDAVLDFQIYGQRIDRRGRLVGDNVRLSVDFIDAEDPSVALGRSGLGLLFNTDIDGRQIVFQRVDFELRPTGAPLVLSDPHSVGASLTHNAGRFVALWHEHDGLPGDAIWGRCSTPPARSYGRRHA